MVARLADGGQPDVGNLDSGDMGGIVAVFSGVLVAEGLDEACHKILIHWTVVHGDRDVLALAEIADISLAEPAALLWHVRVFKQHRPRVQALQEFSQASEVDLAFDES